VTNRDAPASQASGERKPPGGATDESLVEVGSQATLVDAVDRLLNRGAVVAGDVVVSVADVDLVYLNLRVLLTSVDTLQQSRERNGACGESGGTPHIEERSLE
jgi:hypothetical protein